VIVHEPVRRAQRASLLRKDAAATELGMIIKMTSTVTEIPAEFGPGN
jgi:hypothetical protein